MEKIRPLKILPQQAFAPEFRSKTHREISLSTKSNHIKLPGIQKSSQITQSPQQIRSLSTIKDIKSSLLDRQIFGDKKKQLIRHLKPIHTKIAQNSISLLNKAEIGRSITPTPILFDNEKIPMEKHHRFNELLVSMVGLSLRLNSAIIAFKSTGKRTWIPLHDLSYLLYHSEIEVISKIEDHIDKNQEWALETKKYSLIYMTLPYDYPYTSFRYQFERALILLKSQGLNDDKIEDIKIKLVSKGLRLIGQKTVIMTPVLFSQLFNEDSGVLADVAVALCFEGFQAISYIKRLANNPREIGADLMWYLYPPSTIASKLNLIFTQREIQSWSYPLQRMAIANEPDFILNLPSAHLHIGSFSQEFSVSLGLLKQLTEDNFVNWSKILMTYFQEHNDAARIGDESKWLRFLRYNNKEAVIVFNGPSLAIKNQDMDIKYEFKLSDIAALLEISVNHNQDFLRFIISRSTIEGSLHDNSHKITIDLSEFNYEGYGGNLRNINEDIEILRLAIKSQFKMPIVEIFILEDKAKLFKVINNEMCRILVLNNFENWDSILLELF